MNKLAKMAVVVAGLALVSQAAKAANNDLLLGFTGNGSSSDYVINLGNTSTLFGGTSVVDLSSLFSMSTFNSTFSSVNGTMMAAGGGTSSLNPTLFYTQNRGSIGNASTALSLTPPNQTTSNASAEAGHFNAIIGAFSASLDHSGGSATIANSDPNSFTSKITSGSPGSLLGDNGISTSSAIGSGVIYEDLWLGTKSGSSVTFSYQGYLTFDSTGPSASLTFTPKDLAAVPEPSTYGLFGGAGILALAVRRQFRRKTA